MKKTAIALTVTLIIFALAGCASRAGYIGTDRAKQIAFENAGVSESDVVGLEVDLEKEAEGTFYEVSFDSAGYEYEYEIAADSGDVLRQRRELDDDTRLPTPTVSDETPHDGGAPVTEAPEVTEAPADTEAETPAAEAVTTEPPVTEKAPETKAAAPEYIGEPAAKLAALNHAGCAEADIYDYDCEIETSAHCGHEGHSGECRYYDISFDCGGYDYDYEIDAYTGEVLRSRAEEEHHDDEHHAAVTTAKAETKTETQPAATTAAANEYIGGEKARDIALERAGYKSNQVYDLEYELDRERGVAVYDVSFDADDYDYDYEIDAYTGEILRSDKQWDNDYKPDPALNSADYIGSEKAKAAALEHAGLSASDVRELEVELEHRLNSSVYEVSFDSAGYEYEYVINAVSGEIESSKKERD